MPVTNIDVLDGAGVSRNLNAPNSNGRALAASSRPVALSTEDNALLAALGAVGDAAWAAGNGTLVALLKAIATAAVDTTTVSPVQVRSPSDVISIAPTIDTAIYAAGDVLFATTAVAGVTRANDERAVLMSLTGIDKSKQKPAFTLFLYQTNVTSAAANAANNLSDADAANLLGFVRVASTDWLDLANNSMFCLKGINLLLEAAAGTTTVYIVGVLDAGTPTFAAASDLVLKLGVVQS